MSRTDKDKPYWVRANDARGTIQSDIWHRHDKAGKELRITARAKDENGRPLTREVSFQKPVRTVTLRKGETHYFEKVTEYIGFLFEHEHEIVDTGETVREVVRKQPVYEAVSIGFYPTECDAHLPNKHGGWQLRDLGLCVAGLQYWADGYSHNRPRKFERQNHQAAARRQERDVLKGAANAYNSGDSDLWEDDWEEANTRQHRHNGWWD